MVLPLAITKKEQDALQELSLDEIVEQCYLIDRNSKLKYGFLLLEARSRFPADREFGEWRSTKFGDLTQQRATELMNLAKYFSDRPMLDIPVSVGYMLSSPKNVVKLLMFNFY